MIPHGYLVLVLMTDPPPPLFIVMMVTAPCGVAVALLGYCGILKQSRKVLSIYAVLLWPLFGLLTSIGYICYRRRNVSLYQKLKFSWINEYTRDDRLVIQNAVGHSTLLSCPVKVVKGHLFSGTNSDAIMNSLAPS